MTIQGSYSYTPADFAKAIKLLWRGVVTPSAAWIEERPLELGPAAFAGLIDGTISIPKIILRPQPAPAARRPTA